MIERKLVDTTSLIDRHVDSTAIQNALNYFNRIDDHEQIKAACKTRYGVGIRKVEGPESGSPAIETYERGPFNLMVDAGQIESVNIGYGSKIVNAHSTLFSEPGQKIAIMTEDAEKAENAEELLFGQRENGGFASVITSADIMSNQINSGPVFVSYAGGNLYYQSISPGNIQFYFGESVVEDGQERPTDVTDINDASLLIIRLSKADLDKFNYLAIFGKTSQFPNGRQVTYQADSEGTRIPAFGASGASDYTLEDGSPANPLTWFGNENPDLIIPEYPIAIFKGAVPSSDSIMPISLSLHTECLEFNVSASHILSKSNDAAGGATIVSLDSKGQGKPLPRTLTGSIVAQAGQTIEHVALGAGESEISYDTLRKQMVDSGSSRSVPDYMTTSEDHALEASSGIALEVKTRPLIAERKRRIKSNKIEFNRIFDIERGLLGAHLEGDDEAVMELLTSVQDWDPGVLQLPENKKEKTERNLALLDKGIIDIIEAIRRDRRYATTIEAVEEYERMKERKSKYPTLVDQKKQVGLLSAGV